MSNIETVLYKSDRKTYPWYKKVNPLWWFGNDEAQPWDSFTYLYIRNFMMNFKRFVVGVGDRDHYVTGKAPAMTVLRSDIDETGWQWSFIQAPIEWWLSKMPFIAAVIYALTLNLAWWWIVPLVIVLILLWPLPYLPFVSYSGKRVEWYLGWQPWGELCFKFTIKNSSIQVL